MQVIAHARSPRGEMHLRRHDDGTLELRVNGVFVMDTRETTTERLLARLALDALAPVATRGSAGATVLVGGLGLGFTLAELLQDTGVDQILVAEIEPDLVAWHRLGVIPPPPNAGPTLGLLVDPRVAVEEADVRKVVAAQPAGSVDAILLDVDNGPGFLVYDDNAGVYGAGFLQECRRAMADQGVLAIWAADTSDQLLAAMRSVFDGVIEHRVPVTLGRRTTRYHVLVGRGLP